MTKQEIDELAAILLNEHGHAAFRIAEARRDQHRHEPHCDAYLLWDAIAAAVAGPLELHSPVKHREPA
jgi:hypothetical protein